MNSHVKKLGLIEKRIVEQLGVFRLSYRLAIDAKLMERTYQIEKSIAALVAERVRQTGEPEGKVVAVLAEDAVAITSVAVDAHVPPAEIATELQEFRLEVREGLSKLDKKMNKMLDAVHKSICRCASPPLLNHGLHAIDATPARWRGGVGLTQLDSVITAASSPIKDFVRIIGCTRLTG